MKKLIVTDHDKIMVEKALKARKGSYSPYSGFSVGAVVFDEKEGFFSGSNVENSSYGLTVCAERNAVFKAVNYGCENIKKIAVCAETDDVVSPCGSCRQVIYEFGENIEIIMSNTKGKILKHFIKDLLPYGFKL
ncbi:MAG: cytidine deaminase [Candidatus Muiribacteriota bacterium]